MAKKTYSAPRLRAMNLSATEILAGSVTPIGDINTGGSSGNDNYDQIPGFDKGHGGWGTGSPD